MSGDRDGPAGDADGAGGADPATPVLALRPARQADAEALSALVNAAYRGDTSRVGWTTEADLLGGQRTDPDALRDFIVTGEASGDRVLLVHGRAGAIDACVQLERRGDEAYLGMFTVRPTLQGGGLGRRLLAAAEQDVHRRWGSRAVVMTVIAQRSELIAWYARRGYRATGETAPFPYGDARFGEPRRSDLHFVVLRKAFAA